VIAARLAQAGLTASLDAIEHPAGLLMALSPDGKWLATVGGQDVVEFSIAADIKVTGAPGAQVVMADLLQRGGRVCGHPRRRQQGGDEAQTGQRGG